jgi:phycocyanobilin:ferredoxin oxidoreductase
MTNFIKLLDKTARQLKAKIETVPGLGIVPTEDYGWENYRWTSPSFRIAHLEIFNQNRFLVVHLCIFPHGDDPRPIFGFDVIAGENKVTGVFMDLSPTVMPSAPFSNLGFIKSRERPEWGDIFSPHWIACRPNEAEMIAIADETERVLAEYLHSLGTAMHDQRIDEIVAAQNHYCVQQRKNEHTVKAVKNLLGEERANEFITTVLFPTVD